MDRRTWAVGLVASAGAFALVFFVVTVFCGAMERPPGGQAQCVSAPHPLPGLYVLVCALGTWLAWRRMAWAVVGLGALMAGAAVLFMFSLGYIGLGPSVLVLVAGVLLMGTRQAPPPREAPPA